MNRTNALLIIFAVGFIAMTICFYKVAIYDQSAAAQWQNQTSWGYSLCVNDTVYRIGMDLLHDGYIDWCIPLENNQTYCGYLVAQNFTLMEAGT